MKTFVFEEEKKICEDFSGKKNNDMPMENEKRKYQCFTTIFDSVKKFPLNIQLISKEKEKHIY